MEFFAENWLWFLIGGIVILMTLIGYIAEKTDFGRKSISKTSKNTKKAVTKNEEIKLSQELPVNVEPEVQISLATDSILEEPQEENLEQNDMESTEDLNAPFGDMGFEQPINLESEELTEKPNEELNYESDYITEEKSSEELFTEDLNVPFGDVSFEQSANEVSEVIEREPVEELKLENISSSDIELPDLDSIVSSEDDSDDVWKF